MTNREEVAKNLREVSTARTTDEVYVALLNCIKWLLGTHFAYGGPLYTYSLLRDYWYIRCARAAKRGKRERTNRNRYKKKIKE